MKKAILATVIFFGVITLGGFRDPLRVNQSCSVICFNTSWLIPFYTPKEKCNLSRKANGIISVHETYDVTEVNKFKKDFIPFRVLILKKKDQQKIVYSDQIYLSIRAEEVMKKCDVGDKIIIELTNEVEFFLPHNVINILEGGC
jgi:hypothetical protein